MSAFKFGCEVNATVKCLYFQMKQSDWSEMVKNKVVIKNKGMHYDQQTEIKVALQNMKERIAHS